MADNNIFRPLRGALGNLVMWGVGWFAVALAGFAILRVAGVLPGTVSWVEGLVFAIRFGIVGVVGAAAFSSVIRLMYRGRRLAEMSWVRVGIGGGIVTGLIVPVFFQTMNLISGDGLVPWALVLDDGVWAGVVGGVAAAVSLKLAQHAVAVSPRRNQDQLDGVQSVDRLAAAGEGDPLTRNTPARPRAES